VVTAKFFLDNEGYPKAEIEQPFQLLESFLLADVQTPELCNRFLEGIKTVELGILPSWDCTGNLYTVTLSAHKGHIENVYDEDEKCNIPLQDIKQLLVDWGLFMKSKRNH
jgi:hypothetical protein